MTATIPFTFPSRRCAALALVSVLASCGGFTAVSVGGTVTGLVGDGLMLANAGKTITIAPGATTFNFPDQVDIRSTFSVSVVAQPARQTCNIFNANGTAGAAPVTIINVACAANVNFLGGTITGLTGSGLIINNGSDRVAIAPAATTFVLPTRVADGAVYGLTVLAQPTGQVCAVVANGTGVMGGADVDNVKVACQ